MKCILGIRFDINEFDIPIGKWLAGFVAWRVSSGNNPSVLFYPLLSNEPWNNEPFCVEMLGGMEEKALVLGPNPCDEVLQIDGALNQNYRLINLEGACISSGKTNDSGRIDTQVIPNGIYFIILQKGVFRFQVFHGF